MKLLFIGDVVASCGMQFFRAKLPFLKKEKGVDCVIVNGENSSDKNGITTACARYLFDSGADIITTGNHVFRWREFYSALEQDNNILRPANYPPECPGRGFAVFDFGRFQLAVINLMGTVFMDPLTSPFDMADRILNQIDTNLIFVDFHAEATAEKVALGLYLDGRVSAVAGTHTHVQTADECILPQGTGYLTDAGMTGPIHSVIGIKPELALKRMKTHMPVRFEPSSGPCKLNGVLFTLDEKTGKTTNIERISLF